MTEPQRAPKKIPQHWTLAQRMVARTDRSGGPDACWMWLGQQDTGGYGQFKMRPRMMMAHRAAWEVANGPIPDGMYICHHCDNRICCNPAHLFLGTHADNMADRDAKGRTPWGEGHGTAKLSKEQVQLIMSMACSQRQIAKQFGVSQSAIYLIKKGRNWRRLQIAERA